MWCIKDQQLEFFEVQWEHLFEISSDLWPFYERNLPSIPLKDVKGSQFT